MKRFLIAAGAAVALTGCLNMPTQSAQISGAYVSSMPFEQFDCPRLAAEYDSLTRRESQLVIAQDQRVKTSKVQAFWYGFGQGDGVEASELAQVRGEREAVRKAMAVKSCMQPPPGSSASAQYRQQGSNVDCVACGRLTGGH